MKGGKYSSYIGDPVGYITVDDVRRDMMPKVGDRLMLVPSLHKSLGTAYTPPQPCTVVQVHPLNRWYMVQFDAGFRECFKVPEPTYAQFKGRKGKEASPFD